MKKIFLVPLSLFVGFCISIQTFGKTVLPDNFSFLNFSDVKIQSLLLERVGTTPKMDGSLSSGEYPSFTSLTCGEEIYLSVNGSESGETAQQSFSIATDKEYFFITTKITVPDKINFASTHSILGRVYAFTVNLGMAKGDTPASRFSALSNAYYFSEVTGECVGVSGSRVICSDGTKPNYVMKISSYASMYKNNGFAAENGTKWTGDVYRNNTGFSVSKQGDTTTFVIEVKIPVGDVLQSVKGGDKTSVFNQFSLNEGVLCGGFSSEFSTLSGDRALLAGIPFEVSCPYSQEGETWGSVLLENYPDMKNSCVGMDLLPLPLYLCGSAPQKAEFVVPVTGISSETASNGGENQEPGESINDSENVSLTVPEVSEKREDFSHVPSGEEGLPEDTEIVYFSQEKEKEEEKDDGKMTLPGQIILLITSIFLFASIVVFAYVLRKKEDEEKEKSKQKDTAEKGRGEKGRKTKKK